MPSIIPVLVLPIVICAIKLAEDKSEVITLGLQIRYSATTETRWISSATKSGWHRGYFCQFRVAGLYRQQTRHRLLQKEVIVAYQDHSRLPNNIVSDATAQWTIPSTSVASKCNCCLASNVLKAASLTSSMRGFQWR